MVIIGRMEKPFICPQFNCKMSFTNEDHLEVHKRCHDIAMKQSTSVNSFSTSVTSKLPTFVIDQTPTPTNCLKHCEDVSLFQDITLNPFDEEFRKASQLKAQLSIPENNTADSLETPKIPPLADSDETISSTSKDVSSCLMSYPNISTSVLNANSGNLTGRLDKQRSGETDEKQKMRLTINLLPTNENPSSSKQISTPTPVITAGPSVSQQNLLTNESCQNSELYNTVSAVNSFSNDATISELSQAKVEFSQLNAAMIESSDIENANKRDSISSLNKSNPIVSSSPATVLQIVLKLPSGQSIPVEIPAIPVMSSSSLISSATVAQSNVNLMSNPNVPMQNYENNGTSMAKLKLKEALASSNTAAKPGTAKISRANTADRIAEMTKRRISNENEINQELHGFMSDRELDYNTKNESIPKRKRSSSNIDDSIDKRQKFLERNRVAAIRCREKKKQFVKSLFSKSDELEAINQKLQTEVCTLRSEVALLKSLLLRHKDCPVTLALQSENANEEQYPKSFTTFKIQQPSGVITQVTTTPVPSFSPQSQPDESMNDTSHSNFNYQSNEMIVPPPKILVSNLRVAKPLTPIKAAGDTLHNIDSSVGENRLLPDTICLPPNDNVSSAVLLVNRSGPSITATTNFVSKPKPTFIIRNTAIQAKRSGTIALTRIKSTSSPAAAKGIIPIQPQFAKKS